DGHTLRAAGQEVLLLEDGLLQGIRAPSSVLDRPPDRPVAGAVQLLLPCAVRLESLPCSGRRQARWHVRREPRPDLLPERGLLGREGEVHARQNAGSLTGPPSRTSTEPWTKLAAGDRRYRHAAPRSSGRPSRPMPIFRAASSIWAGSLSNRLSSAA